MIKDYKCKVWFVGVCMIVVQSLVILVFYLFMLLISCFGGQDLFDIFFWMVVIFGVIFLVVVFIVVLMIWECFYGMCEQVVMLQIYGGVSFKVVFNLLVKIFGDLFLMLKICVFCQYLFIYLGGYLLQDIFNSVFFFFVVMVLMGVIFVILQLMMVMYVVQLVFVMVVIQIVICIGFVLVYCFVLGLFGVVLLFYFGFYLVWFVGFVEGFMVFGFNLFVVLDLMCLGFDLGLMFWIFVFIVLVGLGWGMLNFVFWLVYNYLFDVDEVVIGQCCEGIFVGVMMLVCKFVMSVVMMVSGWIIDLGGYVKVYLGEVVV